MVEDFRPRARLFRDVAAEREAKLIPYLQRLQKEHGYLPLDELERVADELSVPHSRVHGLASFYSQFTNAPRGRHTVQVCLGTACHVSGGKGIRDALTRVLGINPGETTPDGSITLEEVHCLGCCSLAPVIVVDAVAYGRNDRKKALRTLMECYDQESPGS